MSPAGRVPPRVQHETAHVERRFGLGTIMVGTLFFAVIFALLKNLRAPSAVVISVVSFLAIVAIAQMVVNDERRARVVSIAAGAILAAFGVPIITMIAGRGRLPWFTAETLLGNLLGGILAGYIAGTIMAGIFLVSRIIDDFLGYGIDRMNDPATRVLRSVAEIRAAVRAARADGSLVGLVPTMGALHAGHLELIRRARSESGLVVVSIFVNPMQFGPREDLTKYPRPFDKDIELCRQANVDVVFAPDVSTIYPEGFASFVDVGGLSDRMEGAMRPGHFRGVATVVLKLFNIVQPDLAYFGQKDAQQVQVIDRLIRDLELPVQLRVCSTVRDPDGLALSSRNSYLSPTDREHALSLTRSLQAAKSMIAAGERDANSVRHKMRSVLESAPEVVLDYAELVDPRTFEPITQIAGPVLAVVAARVGSTRLIDNLPIDAHASNPR